MLKVGRNELSSNNKKPNLPRMPLARIRSKQVFVSGLAGSVTAKELHTYLYTCSMQPLQVAKIKTKYGSYSSFVVNVSEIDFNEMFNEDIWASETLIKDFHRAENWKILETFLSE